MICKYKRELTCYKNLHGGKPSDGVCLKICKEREVPELPSLPGMAFNFLAASARHVLSGFRHRTPEQQEQVKAICRVCEMYLEIDGNPRCLHKGCGCFLNVKERWATANCPMNKWPKLKPMQRSQDVVTFICCVASVGDLMCVEPFVRYYKQSYPQRSIRIASKWPELFRRHPDIIESRSCNGERYPNYPDPNLWYSIDQSQHITQWMPTFNRMRLPDDFDCVPRLYLDNDLCGLFLNSFEWDFEQPYVVINANTSTSIREWSWEKWAKVVRQLHGCGYKVVQMGPKEKLRIDGIDLDLMGRTNDLQQAAHVISKSRFYMGADSGFAHLAAAVKKKAVVIFGSGRENTLCHKGYTYPVVGKTNLAKCDICSKERFRYNCQKKPLEICMSMSVDEVWEQVERVMGEL